MKIALVGDYNEKILAHQAIPLALQLASEELSIKIQAKWIDTESIYYPAQLFSEFDGLWCVPGSPYQNMEGALLAIQYAREFKLPFLGTCGGFQHAVIEYARNVLGWEDVEHAETAPNASRVVISPLQCELVEKKQMIYLTSHTKIAAAYGSEAVEEGYRCRYGLNRDFENELLLGKLQVGARDESNEIRAIELSHEIHPFFIATLFQPERVALKEKVPPLVKAFIQAINNEKILD